jgi:DNA polymerase I-like protein with 3'-5' exonuclease and polymerase domains
VTDRNYGAVRSADKLDAFVKKLIADGKPVGFDIESGYTGADKEGVALLNFHPDWILVGWSFTNSTEWARYVPIAHDDGNNIDDPIRAARALWRLLQSGLGVAHNLSFELKGISRYFRETLWDDPEVGEAVRASYGFFPFRSDTMLEVWLWDEYDPLRVGKGLKGITKHVYGHQMVEFLDLFKEDTPKGKLKYVRFNTRDSTLPEVTNYACEDSVWCLQIHLDHYDKVMSLSKLIFQTELALLPILVKMEIEGMFLDWATISSKAAEVAKLRDQMNEQIMEELSERLGEVVSVNLGSPKQLATILFDRLGLPVKQRSEKTNAPSTSEGALRSIAKSDPVMKSILEWREISKLYGSYLHKYETELNYAGTGRAHPNHNQAGAGTGRMSVDGVSYQQWPKPYHYELKNGTTFDLNYRDLLISPPGFRIVGYDYSQVELRVLAGMASETALLQAFKDGTDIHKATASNMFGIPLSDVTKKIRAQGKTLNFAVVYGSGPANIAEMLTSPEAPVSTEDAKELLAKYFAAFSKLKGWMDERVVEGRADGVVFTLFGRKQTIWEYKDSREFMKSKGDRMCVNAPVQGGAADYMKIAMVRADKALRKAEEAGTIPRGGVRLVMTIHDALEFYVHEDVSTQTVIDILNPAISYPVTRLPEIRADWHEGRKWGSVVELKLDDDKQIVGYALDDVDEEFTLIDEAYAYLDAQEAKLHAAKPVAQWIADSVAQTAGVVQDHTGMAAERTADPVADDRDLPMALAPDEPSVAKAFTPEPKRASLGVGDGDLMDLEVDEAKPAPKAPPLDEEEPPWLHGKEWHEEHAKAQRIIVSVMEMPDEDQWAKFNIYLDDRPGKDTLVFVTPEGEVVFDTKHAVQANEQPQISLILGGATVTVAPETVDDDALTEGMDL